MAQNLKAEAIEIKGKPKGGKVKVVKYDRSFLARIIQNKTAKPLYAALKNYCMSFQQVKSRPAWGAESFAVGKDTVVKMVVRGGALCICLALSPDRYDREQYPHKDCSDVKAYESTPMMVPVLSAADLKRTRRLIADAFTERCIYTVESPEEKDYLAELPYESDDALVKKKLIKATESMMEEAAAEKALDEAIREEAGEAEEIASILPKKEKAPRKSKKTTEDAPEEVLFELAEDDLGEEFSEEESASVEDAPAEEKEESIPVEEATIEVIDERSAEEEVPTESLESEREEDREEEVEDVVFELDEDDAEEVVFELARDGSVVEVRYDRSFRARLIQSERAKEYYSDLKNYCLTFGLNPRLSWKGERFYLGRTTYALVKVRGKSLCLYLALSPSDFDEKIYHQKDVSDKKSYEKTPMMVWIRSDLALRKAKKLIAQLCVGAGFSEKETFVVDYAALLPYEERDALIEKGLIKRIERVLEKEEAARVIESGAVSEAVAAQAEAEEMQEEEKREEISAEAESVPEDLQEEASPAEEEVEEVVFDLAEEASEESPLEENSLLEDAPAQAEALAEEEEEEVEEVVFDLAEEVAEEEEDIEDVVFELAEEEAPIEDAAGGMESYGEDDIRGKYVTLRKYVRGFTAKMRQGDQDRKDYYAEIKARMLSFKGVKVLESFSGDSFKKGQKHLLKSRIRGKTLCLFFALDTDEYKQSVYRQQYKGDTKAYADTPMMVRVKSDQGLKRALRLIDELERICLLKPSDAAPSFAEIRKTYLFEETSSLVEKGLVKTRLVTVSRYEAEILLKKKAK